MNLSAAILIFALMQVTAGSPSLSGRVMFANVPVPGAAVTATRGTTTVSTTTGDDGTFTLAVLEDGTWRIHVEMRGFAALSRDVVVPPLGPPPDLILTMQAFDEIVGREAGPVSAIPTAGLVVPKPLSASDGAAQADDPNIINGTAINGAASRFAQPRAFGNNRPQLRSPYSGALTTALGNSAWNATPYSFSTSSRPNPSYGDVNIGFQLTGPLKIPWLVSRGPQMSLGYQHNDQHNATTQSALMPTAAERAGDFSFLASAIHDPLTGLPFGGNVIPSDRISPQARALLAYYPLPNAETTIGANFQKPIVSATTSDRVQFGINQSLTNRMSLAGAFSGQRAVTDSVSLFDFADSSRQVSFNGNLNLTRRISTRTQARFGYQYSRASSSVAPFFAGRTNVSGDAGIAGNDQDPANWGPPSLVFPDLTGLSDAQYQRSVKQTHGGAVEISLRRGVHNVTIGGEGRVTSLDLRSQQDPRGTLTFTGAATGSPFADFLLGVPTTSSIAFGNAHARLREGSYDAYVADDLRISAGLTVNIGARWEYEAPYTEASGGLGNLDVAPDFSGVAPVAASNPVGPVTGRSFPASLVRPDKHGFEPRLAASWRPVLASSLVIRGSYGLYRNLGVYQPLAVLLTQQPPVSRTFSVQTGAAAPSGPSGSGVTLTLANPFPSSVPASSNTFAVDPDFHPGSVQSWNVSVQRDVPASLTVIAAYFGDRGGHLMQAFLPNTYPAGAVNPCPQCPSGFVYVTSNGTSLRNAGQFTVRRRLHAGLMASVQYTLAKSTDDAATFSNSAIGASALAIAQDWRNPSAERGPSSFDQRHLVAVQFQYTTGVGVTGGTLVDGFWGSLFKDWTITSQLNAGSGLPLTPVLFRAVTGTGFVGVRPDLTGVALTPATSGAYVNPAAFTAPAPGKWGNAGRNSIRGPATFTVDMTVARAFRISQRITLEWRVAATNALNRVTFGSIGTVIGSPQFGLPTSANAMRRIQTTFRLSF